MLKDRIISTLKFFDLQDCPLTLLELYRYLLTDIQALIQQTDHQGEFRPLDPDRVAAVGIDKILACLDRECANEVENFLGFYFLTGRQAIVTQRLENYYFGIVREKLIRRYIGGLRHLPFVRGVGLAGSQALGQQREGSDIDLLIIVCPGYLWLARTLVTGYFQFLGQRRYGQKVANRFCLNHYLAGPKEIASLKNLYTAGEYLKLRPLLNEQSVNQFQTVNQVWLNFFFPNAKISEAGQARQSLWQKCGEKLFNNTFGKFLNERLKAWQLPKIRTEKFIVVKEDELSFHPQSKQQDLLLEFYKFQQ